EEDHESRDATTEERGNREQQQTGGLEADEGDNPAALGAEFFHSPRRGQLQQRPSELRQRGEQAGEGLARADGEREGGKVRFAEADHQAISSGVAGAVGEVIPWRDALHLLGQSSGRSGW